jgi:hypothetical protein
MIPSFQEIPARLRLEDRWAKINIYASWSPSQYRD